MLHLLLLLTYGNITHIHTYTHVCVHAHTQSRIRKSLILCFVELTYLISEYSSMYVFHIFLYLSIHLTLLFEDKCCSELKFDIVK